MAAFLAPFCVRKELGAQPGTCDALGMSHETLPQLRLRGVHTPGMDDRRWGCTKGRGPLQWHLENVASTITGWSRKHLPL
jgi:hypothetical protein